MFKWLDKLHIWWLELQVTKALTRAERKIQKEMNKNLKVQSREPNDSKGFN